jgi:hypothetical protein
MWAIDGLRRQGYNLGSLLTGSQLMNPTRVFILGSQPLFAQGVQSLLSGQPGIEVVGVALASPEAFAQVQAAAPNVVIIEAGGEEQGRLVARVLHSIPNARVVGLTLEDNRIHIYYRQMKQGRRVEDLLEAIREPMDWHSRSAETLRLFVLFEGRYGERVLENVRRHAPEAWTVEGWRAPSTLPPVVDGRLAFLPMDLPATDVVLSLGESPAAAELVPAIVERTGARVVIAPVDNVAWLPSDVVRQLGGRLAEMGVVAIFPKPFCSLTERSYNVREQMVSFEDRWAAEFARHFGQPAFRIECEGRRVVRVSVVRDAACGCARAVGGQLVGKDVQEAVVQAGLFHRHYPCLAQADVDSSLGEPLRQIADGLMRRAVEGGMSRCSSQGSTKSVEPRAEAKTGLAPGGRGEESDR